MRVQSGMTVTCKSTHQPRSLAAAALLKFPTRNVNSIRAKERTPKQRKDSVGSQVLSRTGNTNYVSSLFTVPAGSCKSIRYKQTTDRRLLFVMLDDDDEVQEEKK